MSKDCVFNICELWNGLLLGFVSSAVASVLVLLIVRHNGKRELKRRFSKAEGDYTGYRYDQDSLIPETNPASRATIKYKHENLLSMSLTELEGRNAKGENLIWTGEMRLDFETSGTVVWRYLNLDDKLQFGFKRCLMREEDGKFYVYLAGEDPYGKEILVKEPSKLDSR